MCIVCCKLILTTHSLILHDSYDQSPRASAHCSEHQVLSYSCVFAYHVSSAFNVFFSPIKKTLNHSSTSSLNPASSWSPHGSPQAMLLDLASLLPQTPNQNTLLHIKLPIYLFDPLLGWGLLGLCLIHFCNAGTWDTTRNKKKSFLAWNIHSSSGDRKETV